MAVLTGKFVQLGLYSNIFQSFMKFTRLVFPERSNPSMTINGARYNGYIIGSKKKWSRQYITCTVCPTLPRLGVKADSGGRELFRRPLRSRVTEAAGLPLYSLFRIYSVFHLFLVYLRSLHAIAAVSFQVHIRLRRFSFWHGLAWLNCFCSSAFV